VTSGVTPTNNLHTQELSRSEGEMQQRYKYSDSDTQTDRQTQTDVQTDVQTDADMYMVD